MKLGRLEGLNKKGRFLSPSTSLDTIVTVEIEPLCKPSHPAVSGVIYLYLSRVLFGEGLLSVSISTGYDSVAGVGETGVWLRAGFQRGSRVLKKVF